MQLRPEFFPARLHHADRDFSARGVTDCACNVVLKVRHMRQQIPAGGENKGREKKVRSHQRPNREHNNAADARVP